MTLNWFDELEKSLEIPTNVYEMHRQRYEHLGEWLGSHGQSAKFSPEIFPQGSFSIGTVITPIDKKEGYDLDIVCNLTQGVSPEHNTQQQLKELVGNDIKAYAQSLNITANHVKEKRRCWCLTYKDGVKFYIDILPSIPADSGMIDSHQAMITAAGVEFDLARNISNTTILITDNENNDYNQRNAQWLSSNPRGYAEWFKSCMKSPMQLSAESGIHFDADIKELPMYEWKTPLQKSVQILKRHRDIMFKGKTKDQPISIIITTLSAMAYQNETDTQTALANIINWIDQNAKPGRIRIPNPTHPEEDFADKWKEKPNKQNQFFRWLAQLKIDFKKLTTAASKQEFLTALIPFGLAKKIVPAKAVSRPHTNISQGNLRPHGTN